LARSERHGERSGRAAACEGGPPGRGERSCANTWIVNDAHLGKSNRGHSLQPSLLHISRADGQERFGQAGQNHITFFSFSRHIGDGETAEASFEERGRETHIMRRIKGSWGGDLFLLWLAKALYPQCFLFAFVCCFISIPHEWTLEGNGRMGDMLCKSTATLGANNGFGCFARSFSFLLLFGIAYGPCGLLERVLLLRAFWPCERTKCIYVMEWWHDYWSLV